MEINLSNYVYFYVLSHQVFYQFLKKSVLFQKHQIKLSKRNYMLNIQENIKVLVNQNQQKVKPKHTLNYITMLVQYNTMLQAGQIKTKIQLMELLELFLKIRKPISCLTLFLLTKVKIQKLIRKVVVVAKKQKVVVCKQFLPLIEQAFSIIFYFFETIFL